MLRKILRAVFSVTRSKFSLCAVALSIYLFYIISLLGAFKESGQTEFVVKDVPSDCLKILIDYINTGLLKFDSTNVERLLLAASFLQITLAEELFCLFLIENLTLDNCFKYIKFAGKHYINTLRQKALQTAVLNFSEIYSRDEYLEIEFEEFKTLVELLSSEPIKDFIYSFIMRWVHHSFESRVDVLKDLLNNLDPLQISPNLILSSRVSPRPNHFLDEWAAPATSSSNWNEPQEQILLAPRIIDFSSRIVKLFTCNNALSKINPVPGNTFEGSYVCFGYNIFHLGGWRKENLITDEVYMTQQNKNIWYKCSPLLKARAYHRSCVLDETIYTLGGSDGCQAFPHVESFDLHTGRRVWCEELPQATEQMGLAIHENSLYTIGGKNRAINLNCVHRFDPRIGNWEEKGSPSYRSGASSCAVVYDDIYTTHKDALQRYDIRTNSWTLIRTQCNSYPDQVFTYDHKLYGLFKGYIGIYVPEKEEWSVYRQIKYLHFSNYFSFSTGLRVPIADHNDEDSEDDNDHDYNREEEQEYLRYFFKFGYHRYLLFNHHRYHRLRIRNHFNRIFGQNSADLLSTRRIW